MIDALRLTNEVEVTQMNGIREDIEFRLPPELRSSELLRPAEARAERVPA